MKRFWIIGIMVVGFIFGVKDSAFSMITEDSITYPPKQKETTLKELVDAGKGLAKETTELGKAMVNGVKEDGGIVATVKRHKKFYLAIFVFSLLTLIWFKTREK